jgi:myo-inositol-1(or 4)-monophosphatase
LPASDTLCERAALCQILIDAVRDAGTRAASTFRTPMKTWTKGNGSPVCEADLAIDALLRERLTAAAPDYGWLSEESADDPGRLSARRVWVVDPIDGTRAYIGGLSDWAVSAALVENGRPILGAIFAPVEGALYWASAGDGARLNGKPIQTSNSATLSGRRLAGPRPSIEKLAALAPGIDMVPKIHSLALRFAHLAEGTLDAVLASRASHDWDVAAADLLVHEAAGVLTTTEGRILRYNQVEPIHEPLIAAGPFLHRLILDAMNARKTRSA